MDFEVENPWQGLQTLQRLRDDLAAKCVELTSCGKCLHGGQSFPSHREFVSKLEGLLILTDFPYFGFVLRCKSIDYFLILSNPVNIITSYLKANGRKVHICNSHLVLEHYPAINDRFFPHPVNLSFLEVQENAVILENRNSEVQTVDTFKNTHRSHTILILHTTAPLVIQGVAICIVFVKFIYSEGRNLNIWLVLRGSMVSWSVGLFTGYKYELLIENSIPNNIFTEHKQHLKTLLPLEMQESFSSIFHHPRLFSTMDASFVPADTKLKLICPSLSSSPVKALSVKEASCENIDFCSIFGQVLNVNHAIRKPSTSCIICKKKAQNHPQEPTPPYGMDFHSAKKYFKVSHTIPKSGVVFPPSQTITVKNPQKTFGTLGCLVKEVLIKDAVEDCEVGLYLRDNYFQCGLESALRSNGFFYPGGILPGSIVCFENVVKKIAKAGHCYYLTSPFTKITILREPNDNEKLSSLWFSLDPPPILSKWKAGQTFWFHSDLDELLSVKFVALCDTCGCILDYRGACPSRCTDKIIKLDATALLGVNHHRLPNYSLILKDELVRTYLGANDTLWKWFTIAAKKSPLAYSKDMVHKSHENEFSKLFKHYCDSFRPKVRFHVCARIMNQKEGQNHAVFCVALSPVDVKRTLAHALEDNATPFVMD